MSNYPFFWAISAVVLVGFLVGIGVGIKGKAWGVFADARNKYSLSRLQLVLWTVLILSAFFVVAFERETMDIYLSPEIWALMGISLGSTAGAVIVKGTKAAKQPSAAAAGKSMGVLAVSERPSFADMFKGEEVTDQDYVDIAKVQMFFFTIAAVAGYLVALWNSDFSCPASAFPDLGGAYAVCFPKLSPSLVTLLAISHAGYLTVKAAPNTPTK